MSTEPDETALLIAFARAASKAQEIEALLQETVIGFEVLKDARNRSFTDIAKEIDQLTLGQLKRKYLETVGKHVADPEFEKMWNEINHERIFLMHKFFHVFPIAGLNGNKDAEQRLNRIDKLLDIGRRLLEDALKMTLEMFKLPPTEYREFLAFAVDHRKKSTISE
jgi:hypothetical protein